VEPQRRGQCADGDLCQWTAAVPKQPMAIDRPNSCFQQPNGTSVESPTDAASARPSRNHWGTAHGAGALSTRCISCFQSVAIGAHRGSRRSSEDRQDRKNRGFFFRIAMNLRKRPSPRMPGNDSSRWRPQGNQPLPAPCCNGAFLSVHSNER
jgi:hypothetical protein